MLKPEDMKSGDQLIMVTTFNLRSPIREHINYLLTTGLPSEELIILTYDQSIKVDIMNFEPVFAGAGILFATSEKAKKLFESVWQDYTDRYDWDPIVDTMPVLSNNRINGYLVEHLDGIDNNRLSSIRMEKFKLEFSWILSNTKGKVWWSKMFWLFEDQADAALFKLQQ